ncbi:hypothetical protein MKEN_00805000 [Mycena kentingensis (nom. inval.)]|nr:hypothetical protein MKEN_00805000 [Mycena kentingensis (nom. inval.)]
MSDWSFNLRTAVNDYGESDSDEELSETFPAAQDARLLQEIDILPTQQPKSNPSFTNAFPTVPFKAMVCTTHNTSSNPAAPGRDPDPKKPTGQILDCDTARDPNVFPQKKISGNAVSHSSTAAPSLLNPVAVAIQLPLVPSPPSESGALAPLVKHGRPCQASSSSSPARSTSTVFNRVRSKRQPSSNSPLPRPHYVPRSKRPVLALAVDMRGTPHKRRKLDASSVERLPAVSESPERRQFVDLPLISRRYTQIKARMQDRHPDMLWNLLALPSCGLVYEDGAEHREELPFMVWPS